ncbi:MAG: TylF/MycF/NovP-related O-methyltransferase [Pseudomonadota bacterium]
MTISESVKPLISRLRSDRITYLPDARLQSIIKCIDEVKAKCVPGNFAEFGLALGGSGILIANQLDANRRFLGFDVFGMIPPPSDADGPDVHERYEIIRSGQSRGIGGTGTYYGYRDDLLAEVSEAFTRHGVAPDGERVLLHQGLFEDTIHLLGEEPVAFAHIDCDWYDPSLLCLDEVAARMPEGGMMIVDDFQDWSGSRKASLEFLLNNEQFIPVAVSPHLVIRHGKAAK